MTLPSAPGVLLVLDGWGHAPTSPDNAITRADTPTLDALAAKFPTAYVDASGAAVGLLPGTVGNSEIGHMVIGAGRPLEYDSLLVQRAIDNGALRGHPLLAETLRRVTDDGKALHLIGLASDGQIHAHVEHLRELLAIAAAHRVSRVWIHAITDGRDVADGTAADYLRRVEAITAEAGTGRIATVSGRGYALDKSGDLELTRLVTEAIADATGPRAASAEAAVVDAPRGDVWIEPTVVTGGAAIADGDAVLFTNFRSDRIQQLADGLLDHLAAGPRAVTALSLAVYDTRAPIPPLVPRADASGGLADELERHGLTSVRIAEKEKFEHVTYYINGRDDRPRTTEEHIRVTGDVPPDYVARPEMNLDKVTDAVVDAVARPDVDLVVANLANIDVVGHTGHAEATVRATEFTDAAVDRIRVAAQAAGRWVLLVGDHGNAEVMAKPGPDGIPRPYGGHTTNPVPAIVVPAPGAVLPEELPTGGTLADIAPTVLSLLGRPAGPAMTGRSLV
ncbi:2,3-bisphosphoglycerate-independent phosphoglycerate mutase [Streptomyces sp. TRM76323]|uniref:2,3-bisphosphoglycerate-independent phosphoglycerate mutase n=1 Tax=Streptomyces tamarix TaxID=3078565 RepID=A0ABU3QLS7_9ACTN|nr:2,3-bisphosphoglycerate-independent phosphoglycerate mutase [Streptomyces tamarix]MDT9683725.1 2,3-bisphosphoglycerate-independent phosphoglycerate mutase [Streptomyces tamarix]